METVQKFDESFEELRKEVFQETPTIDDVVVDFEEEQSKLRDVGITTWFDKVLAYLGIENVEGRLKRKIRGHKKQKKRLEESVSRYERQLDQNHEKSAQVLQRQKKADILMRRYRSLVDELHTTIEQAYERQEQAEQRALADAENISYLRVQQEIDSLHSDVETYRREMKRAAMVVTVCEEQLRRYSEIGAVLKTRLNKLYDVHLRTDATIKIAEVTITDGAGVSQDIMTIRDAAQQGEEIDKSVEEVNKIVMESTRHLGRLTSDYFARKPGNNGYEDLKKQANQIDDMYVDQAFKIMERKRRIA